MLGSAPFHPVTSVCFLLPVSLLPCCCYFHGAELRAHTHLHVPRERVFPLCLQNKAVCGLGSGLVQALSWSARARPQMLAGMQGGASIKVPSQAVRVLNLRGRSLFRGLFTQAFIWGQDGSPEQVKTPIASSPRLLSTVPSGGGLRTYCAPWLRPRAPADGCS